MNLPSPVVVTGANGRLGRAVTFALRNRGLEPLVWNRPDYDLDDPATAQALVARDRPRLVIHCAAWTDVDGCARDPDLALRRNGAATGELAAACAKTMAALVYVSTNEVFDGKRTSGAGYREDDVAEPINPYGASKLHGERLALAAYSAAGASELLWIVRTAWLFGPPGNDFPLKIVAAADRIAPGESLAVVADETGSPTYAVELASALVGLIAVAPGQVYHLAATGAATRDDVARRVIERCRPGVPLKQISRNDFERASEAPQWSVLDSSRAADFGILLRPWTHGLSDYLEKVCPPQK